MGYTAIGTQAVAIKASAHRALTKARNSFDASVLSSASPRFLSVEAQEAMLAKVRQLRLPNNLETMELTILNNQYGPGVVVSGLGEGTALQAGLCVGDVITEVNGISVTHHEQALQAMRDSPCRDIVLSLVGKARAVRIDKYEPGKLQVTLGSPQSGPGVEVKELGLMGLFAANGVRAGDIVLSVNGTLVTDHVEAIALMDSTDRHLEVVLAQTDLDDWDSVI